MSDSNSPSRPKRETDYGKACVFMARLCGILASFSESPSNVFQSFVFFKSKHVIMKLSGSSHDISISVILLCGLVSLLPLPSFTTSLKDYPRCLGVGFIFM